MRHVSLNWALPAVVALFALVPAMPLRAGGNSAPGVVPLQGDGVQRTTILVESYRFIPNRLVVQAGVPVELILVSKASLIPHEFRLDAPEAGMSVSLDIGAGETAYARFTPTRPGSYTFYCGKRLLFFKSHRAKGMEGELTVVPAPVPSSSE